MSMDPNEGFFHPGYEEAVFRPDKFKKLVKQMAEGLDRLKNITPFQALAASGQSGFMLIGALSYEIGVPIITVRKTNEEATTMERVSGYLGADSYVIVDDLIGSGRTIKHIVDSIEHRRIKINGDEYNRMWKVKDVAGKLKPAAIVLYNDWGGIIHAGQMATEAYAIGSKEERYRIPVITMNGFPVTAIQKAFENELAKLIESTSQPMRDSQPSQQGTAQQGA